MELIEGPGWASAGMDASVHAAPRTAQDGTRNRRTPKPRQLLLTVCIPLSQFNLELPDTDHFRQELRTWRSVSSLLSPAPSPAASLASPPQPVPSMVLDIILDTCSMTPNQVLVLSDQRGRRVRVDSTTSASPPPSGLGHSGPSNLSAGGSSGVRSPRLTRPNVLLERWTLTLVPPFSPSAPPELPSVYKQAIVLFRTLYTLMRTLPAWGLYRRLARRKAGVGGAGLQIGCRMSMGDEGDREGEVGVDVGIAERPGEKTTETIVFPGVQTPTGCVFYFDFLGLASSRSGDQEEGLTMA